MYIIFCSSTHYQLTLEAKEQDPVWGILSKMFKPSRCFIQLLCDISKGKFHNMEDMHLI